MKSCIKKSFGGGGNFIVFLKKLHKKGGLIGALISLLIVLPYKCLRRVKNLLLRTQKSIKYKIRLATKPLFIYLIRYCFKSYLLVFKDDRSSVYTIRKKRKTPIAPWAFIRVKNEIITIDTCLTSILPAIQKGVIGFHDCDDGTQEYIYAFCKKHPGFIPVKYPHKVYPTGHEAYKYEGEEEKKLHTYYNAVLAHIPQNEWLIKIDCDHVYDAQKLKESFYLDMEDTECLSYPRLNLHYENEQLYFLKNDPYVQHADHWLIKNRNLSFEVGCGYITIRGTRKFYAWELLRLTHHRVLFAELSTWHFPRMKKNRYIEKTELEHFSRIKKYLSAEMYIDKKTMLDARRILSFCKTFNVSGQRIFP